MRIARRAQCNLHFLLCPRTSFHFNVARDCAVALGVGDHEFSFTVAGGATARREAVRFGEHLPSEIVQRLVLLEQSRYSGVHFQSAAVSLQTFKYSQITYTFNRVILNFKTLLYPHKFEIQISNDDYLKISRSSYLCSHSPTKIKINNNI